MLTNINEVCFWQTALHRLAEDHLVASDSLKPTSNATVRIPPQSIDKKIYPRVERNHYLLSKPRIDINAEKFIIAAAGNKERLL